jgi:SSS family solute:Na+ symporter
MSGDNLVLSGRLATLSFMALAVIWAPQIDRFQSLWQYLQATLAYAVPPVLALFLVGMFWRGANATGAAATLLLGTCAGVMMFLSNVIFHWTNLHFLYVAPILLAFSATILVAVSLASAGTTAGSATLVWTPAFFREETATLAREPAWRNYRYLAVALLALTGSIVYAFR